MASLKIRTVLRWMALFFAIVPVVIMSVVGIFSMSGFAKGSIEQYARSGGKAQSETINQVFGKYEDIVLLLADDSKVISFAQRGKAENNEEKEFLDKLFFTMMSKGYDVKNITVMNTEGTVLLDHAGVQKAGVDYFYGFEELEKANISASAKLPYLSKVYSGTSYGDDVFFLAYRMLGDNGENVGYVALTAGMTKLKSLLVSTTYGQGSGYLALSDGTDVVYNFEDAAEEATAKHFGEINSDILGVFKSDANTGITDYDAGGYLGCSGYITGVSNSSWKWICVYPGGMALSQIIVPLLVSLLVMLAAAALFAVLGHFGANAMVSPINKMIQSIREVKESGYDSRIDVKSSGDFASIADLFNNMLDEVCMSEELHKTVSDISDNMLFEWDINTETMYCSTNFLEKFDLTAEDSRLEEGKFLDKLMTEDQAAQFNKDINTMMKNRNGHSGEYEIKTKSGTAVWFAIRTMCVTDRLGEPLRIIGVVRDIDNEKKMELQLSERASYDFLSQLYNRSTFERELAPELERNAHSRVALLFVDVDDFKFINDRYGHSVGDEVIKFVADSLKSRISGSGFAGRFGGDEFVLCISDQEQIDNAENIAMDLIDELYNGYYSELANSNINVKASIGIAISPEHGKTSQTLIAAADEAMYFVKKNGKSNYHVYRPEDSMIEGLQHTL